MCCYICVTVVPVLLSCIYLSLCTVYTEVTVVSRVGSFSCFRVLVCRDSTDLSFADDEVVLQLN